MIQTIHLGHLLRETVASPYRNLVTRPTGAAIRNRIQEALAGSDCLTALLDFSDIELLDFSCADEVVAKLLLDDGERTGCFVVLRGLREDQHEAIEHVLTHHRLVVAAMAPGHEHEGPRLLGWVTADARAAFECLCTRGALTAGELAQALTWPAARGADALESLAAHRVARADEGRYHPLPFA
ncbi:MAG TPA: hypothetical protein VMY76_15740 [Gemmatimonadales bacterium]|nr:hypothetical protein [Gemmatimonadales bacterium]